MMPGVPQRRILDILCEQFPDTTRKDLYAALMCGEIRVDGHTVRDPGLMVPPDVTLHRHVRPFVSRGGLKLSFALSEWGMDVTGGIFLDAGASTGGFTDCLLQRGAGRVHAVDVGYNQLAWKLRSDSRVIVHERCNVMDLDALEPVPRAAVADLSFRSLRGAAAKIISLTREGWCIALVKPQFENRYGGDGFDGVIRNSERLAGLVSALLEDLLREGVCAEKLLRSPITGAKGNTELLALLKSAETGKAGDIDSLLYDALSP